MEKMDDTYELMLDMVRDRTEHLSRVPSELQTFEMCEDAVTRSPTSGEADWRRSRWRPCERARSRSTTSRGDI